MIACLQGELLRKNPESVVVNVGGVGYEVFFPESGQDRLPEVGQEVFLHVQTVVREDAFHLYGFLDAVEKELFQHLVGVSGIGPRTASNVLAAMAAAEFCRAVLDNDIARLTRLPGVGKKTAERLCLELKDKVRFQPLVNEPLSTPAAQEQASTGQIEDAVSALVNLGYPQARASQALEQLRSRFEEQEFLRLSLEELLRHALRSLA